MRNAVDSLNAFGSDKGRLMKHGPPVDNPVSNGEDMLQKRSIFEYNDDFFQDSNMIDVEFDYVNLIFTDETNMDGGLLRFQSLAEDVQNTVLIAQDRCLYWWWTTVECQNKVLHDWGVEEVVVLLCDNNDILMMPGGEGSPKFDLQISIHVWVRVLLSE